MTDIGIKCKIYNHLKINDLVEEGNYYNIQHGSVVHIDLSPTRVFHDATICTILDSCPAEIMHVGHSFSDRGEVCEHLRQPS